MKGELTSNTSTKLKTVDPIFIKLHQCSSLDLNEQGIHFVVETSTLKSSMLIIGKSSDIKILLNWRKWNLNQTNYTVDTI